MQGSFKTLFIFLCAFFSAAILAEPAPPPDAAMRHHWGYESQKVIVPSKWSELHGAKTCSSPLRQSPIQIPVKSALSKNPKNTRLKYKYPKDLKFFVFHNSHTIQATVANPRKKALLQFSQGAIKSKYALKQFHYHVPSEHSLLVAGKNKKFFAELHFVHENVKKPGEILVYGIFVALDKNLPRNTETNEVLDQWVNAYHASGDYLSGILPIELDINKLLPKSGPHAIYKGSLTTPPCSEVVTWVVSLEPIHVDSSHFENLRKYIRIGFENARPTQKMTEHHRLQYFRL